jgi:hypothetical protein
VSHNRTIFIKYENVLFPCRTSTIMLGADGEIVHDIPLNQALASLREIPLQQLYETLKRLLSGKIRLCIDKVEGHFIGFKLDGWPDGYFIPGRNPNKSDVRFIKKQVKNKNVEQINYISPFVINDAIFADKKTAILMDEKVQAGYKKEKERIFEEESYERLKIALHSVIKDSPENTTIDKLLSLLEKQIVERPLDYREYNRPNTRIQIVSTRDEQRHHITDKGETIILPGTRDRLFERLRYEWDALPHMRMVVEKGQIPMVIDPYVFEHGDDFYYI